MEVRTTFLTPEELREIINYSSLVRKDGGEEGKIGIEKDSDSNLPYELIGWQRKLVNLFFLPIMSLLANFSKLGVWIFFRSIACRSVRKYATGHKALEIIYTFPWKNLESRPFVDRIASKIFFNILNAKAVRNRRLLVQRELSCAINGFWSRDVMIASLGSGSARPVLEVISGSNQKNIRAMLVDADKSAIKYSKSLAKKFGLDARLSWHRGLIKKFLKEFDDSIGGFLGSIIFEMVGIIDYLSDEVVIDLFKSVRSRMVPGDLFITCNIAPNPEKRFMDRIIGWKMDYYRAPERLANLAVSAGFNPVDCRIIGEPIGIHWILICRVVNADKEVN